MRTARVLWLFSCLAMVGCAASNGPAPLPSVDRLIVDVWIGNTEPWPGGRDSTWITAQYNPWLDPAYSILLNGANVERSRLYTNFENPFKGKFNIDGRADTVVIHSDQSETSRRFTVIRSLPQIISPPAGTVISPSSPLSITVDSTVTMVRIYDVAGEIDYQVPDSLGHVLFTDLSQFSGLGLWIDAFSAPQPLDIDSAGINLSVNVYLNHARPYWFK